MTFPIHSSQPMPTYTSPSGQATVTYPSSNQSSAIYSSNQPPQVIAPPSRQSPTYPSEHIAGYSSPNVSPPYQTSSGIQPAPVSTYAPSSPYASPSSPLEKDSQPAPIERPSTSSQQQSYPPAPIPSQSSAYSHSRTPSAVRGLTFGVPIEDVVARENATLPLIVAQCVVAVDQFGLRIEGIYRVSGSATNTTKLKHLFDFEPDHIDFRTPAGFFDDIHAVAGILKQYLRELPEPLLTRGFYSEFLRAACISLSHSELIVSRRA
jgi:Rho GTPase-activating protein RGD1